jgi:hypothetical protein
MNARTFFILVCCFRDANERYGYSYPVAGIPPRPDPSPFDSLTGYRRHLFGMFTKLWETGYTPQSFVRTAGPWGHKLVRQYCTRRFPDLEQEDMENVVQYIHGITCLDGTGEYALSRLLAPGAWARRPLAPRLSELQMPVVFYCKFRYL